MGGWGVNCSGLKANPPLPCISRIQAQEFSGWGFSGLGKQKASWQRQESIDSVTDTDLPLTMCQALCWALGIQLHEEIRPLPLRSLSPTGKTEHEQIITV